MDPRTIIEIGHAVLTIGGTALVAWIGLSVKAAIKELQVDLLKDARDREDKMRSWAEGSFVKRAQP